MNARFLPTAIEVRKYRESTGLSMMQSKEILIKKNMRKALREVRETKDFELLYDIIEGILK